MTYWRMKLRDGTHGEDMWGPCRNAGVAAITYPGITWVDLRPYSKQNRPPEWNQIGSPAGKGSIAHFAWKIRGGDAIYIGDSATHQLVGMGYVTAKIGQLAYRFDAHSRIVPFRGDPWCHLIDVDWDTSFTPFGYKDRAPQTTVLELKKNEIQDFEQASHTAEHRNKGLGDKDIRKTFLLETAYPRYTPAAQRLILRKHSILSNCFRRWLENKPVAEVSQERQQMDITFKANRRRYLAEFKIAYQGDTKRAIREALGQVLEYNHYPSRTSHDYWLLILDAIPSDEDISFLQTLKVKFGFPLRLGWQKGTTFKFTPTLDFQR